MLDPLFDLCIAAAPSRPDDLLRHWSLSPLVLLPLAAGLALIVSRAARPAPALAGWALLALALVSPLCRLAADLLSAHMVQLALISIMAPALIAGGFKGRAPAVGPAALAYGALIWLWHVPSIYELTLSSRAAHLALLAGLVGSAVLFFRALIEARDGRLGAALAALLATLAHTGLLGALLTFAPRPLYRLDPATLLGWGLSPLADQQIAGLIMWVPGGALYIAFAAWLMAARLWPGGAARQMKPAG